MITSRDLRCEEMTEKEFPKTWAVVRDAIEAKVTPGVVAGFWSRKSPDTFRALAFGKRRLFPSEQDLSIETPFDLASLTKIMGTSTLAARLVDRGWIGWDTRLSEVLPGYGWTEIRLRHLLSHTAGFVAWRPFYEELNARYGGEVWRAPVEERQRAMRELVMSVAPDARPGEKCLYSDVSFLLLGFALEEITQMRLDRAVEEMVLKPLGLESAGYRPVTAKASEQRDERIAATEDSAWRGGVLQGQVHDDNTWAMGGYAGHAGLFGRLRDVLQFARAYPESVSARTLAATWTRVPEPAGCERTLGWDTPGGERPSAGRLFSRNSVGHLGFTGTSLWIDPEAELAVALLTNRVHPSRENTAIRDFRPLFHDSLRQEIRSRR